MKRIPPTTISTSRLSTSAFFDPVHDNFHDSTRELRSHFCNPNLVDLIMIQLEALKYDRYP